jgi:hypothetical protein
MSAQPLVAPPQQFGGKAMHFRDPPQAESLVHAVQVKLPTHTTSPDTVVRQAQELPCVPQPTKEVQAGEVCVQTEVTHVPLLQNWFAAQHVPLHTLPLGQQAPLTHVLPLGQPQLVPHTAALGQQAPLTHV